MPERPSRSWLRRLRGRGSPPPAAGDDGADFDRLAQTWNTLGENDPLWAVLTHPGTEGGRWDVEEFFKDGQLQVDGALALVEKDIGWTLATGSALDFGCGVGRLTQALCARFDRVDGVDIAPSMIEGAERFNRFGDRCRYHLNVEQDLSIFADGAYDFIYSTYVLQHMHPTFARRYVEEFVRLLSPAGLALFQIPTAKRGPAANDPLPDEAFVDEVSWETPPPDPVTAGDHADVRIRVTNRSATTWPSRGERAVRAGARWRVDGRPIGGEARAELPADLAPGEEAGLAMELSAPGAPGPLVLEAGLLQEGVAWFADRGGALLRADVEVLAPPEAAAASAVAIDAEPPMEMHATPVPEVERWVTSAGGRVVRVVDAPPDEHFEGALFAVAAGPA
jgi:SAM-dependent methyltransferase